MSEAYQGIITKFLVKQKDWGLALFHNFDQEKLKLKIKGNIGAMELRQPYEITGQLEINEKFGPAFQVKSFRLIALSQKKAALKYLNSANFSGVTPDQAALIFNQLGPNWLAKIQKNPKILEAIPDFNPNLIPIIQNEIKKNWAKSPIEQKFQDSNLNLAIYDKLKDITLDEMHLESLLKDNFLTWSYRKNLGSPQDLDDIAITFGLKNDSSERVGFWLTHLVEKILWKTGDTYTDLKKLKEDALKKFDNLDSPTLIEGLLYAKNEKWLYFMNHKIYSRESWIDEEDIVANLASINNCTKPISQKKITELLTKTEAEVRKLLKIESFRFDSSQRECLEKLIKNPVLIISGGPGSGKSTLIVGLAILFHLLEPKAKINVTTPTGRASIRLKSVIPDFDPMTLHRLLEFDENEFHRNERNPLEAKLVIIDEMSMVDNHLFASFLRAAKNLNKLVLVGDINQLPPVNYGDIFHDLISSKAFAIAHLSINHRQNQESGIIKLAEAIQNNSLQNINLQKLKNVEFISEENLEDLITLKLDYSRYCSKPDFDVMSYQIVAPIYRGLGGIDIINQSFQKEFNPYFEESAKVYQKGTGAFYTINDKIICNRNFPEYDLANGEVGVIKELEFKDQELIRGCADFGGKIVPLNKELFKSISLCYACSIHKTQGSEYQKIALILNDYMQPNSFLNKKLVYTAVTRAKEELLIIGKRELFIKIACQQAVPRLSTILEKIKNQLVI